MTDTTTPATGDIVQIDNHPDHGTKKAAVWDVRPAEGEVMLRSEDGERLIMMLYNFGDHAEVVGSGPDGLKQTIIRDREGTERVKDI